MSFKKLALCFCIAATSISAQAGINDPGNAVSVTVTDVTSLVNVDTAWVNVNPVPAECDFHPAFGGPHITIPLTTESGRLAASIALTAKSTGSNVNIAWGNNCVIENISILP